MTATIIGLAGRAGSGKSTLAGMLAERRGLVVVKMAAPLKAMLRAIGLTDYDLEGAGKEVPMPLLCGRTPRHAMQTLGTEWGRSLMGTDIWVNAWVAAARHAIDTGAPGVVCDDVRFEDEARAIHRIGGGVWKIIGRGATAPDGHASEAGDFATDGEIDNSGGIDDLAAAADRILAEAVAGFGLRASPPR